MDKELLIQTDLTNVRRLFDKDLRYIYNQLKNLISPKLVTFFAEPLIHSHKLTGWLVDKNKNFRSYTTFNDSDKMVIKEKLELKLAEIKQEQKKIESEEWRDFLNFCLEIPMQSCFYFSPTTQELIIIQWGFISDSPGNQRGVLNKIVPQRIDVGFDIRCKHNNKPIKNVELEVTFNNTTSTILLENSALDYNNIKEGSLIKIFYEDSTGKKELFNKRVFKNERFLIEIDCLREVTLIFTDNEVPKPDLSVRIKYANVNTTVKIDSNGKIILKDVPVNEKIDIYIEDELILNQSRTLTILQKQNEYIIRIPADMIKVRVATIKNIIKAQHIKPIEAQISLVLDKSGSMMDSYTETGKVQELLNKILPISLALSYKKELDVWAYDDSPVRLPFVNIDNYETYIKREITDKTERFGENNEVAVLKDIIQKYYVEQNTQIPIYIIFVTDGDVDSGSGEDTIEKIIEKNIHRKIFWQFLGLGENDYGILENLKFANTNFFWEADFSSVKEEDLYPKFLNASFTTWLQKIK